MRPPAEQLLRDYLNRVSVAARGKLEADDRRELLARTRLLLEQRSSVPGSADPAEVVGVLADLGEPEALVEREQARLAAEHSARQAAASRRGSWHPSSADSAADQADRPGQAVQAGQTVQAGQAKRPGQDTAGDDGMPSAAGSAPEPALEPAERMTGEVTVHNRPITSRWHPGAPLQPRQTGPHRIPRFRPSRSRRSGGDAADTGSGLAGDVGEAGEGAPRTDARTGVSDNGSPSAPSAARLVPPARRPTGSLESIGLRGTPDAPETPEASGTEPGLPSEIVRITAPGGAPPGAPSETTRHPVMPSEAGRSLQPQSLLAGGAVGLASGVADLWRRHPLECTAAILMAIGGLMYPYPIWVVAFLIWAVGVVVALFSRLWDDKDKWAGVAGQVALVILGTAIGLAIGGKRGSLGAYGHEALADAANLIRAGAVLGPGYLLWRARKGPRKPAVPPWNRPHHFWR